MASPIVTAISMIKSQMSLMIEVTFHNSIMGSTCCLIIDDAVTTGLAIESTYLIKETRQLIGIMSLGGHNICRNVARGDRDRCPADSVFSIDSDIV